MDFLPQKIERYIEEMTEEEPSLLKELNHETWEKALIPRMLSGHVQGRCLSALSNMIKPQNILEIGTYTGYSALCLAEGLTKTGMIHTIDINEEIEPIASKYIKKSIYKNNIKQYTGNALAIIPNMDIGFDLIFIDADKINYLNYYHLVIDKLNSGGYIIADNVLWSGKVTQPREEMDKDTLGILEYSEFVKSDARVQNVMFPIRDGLMITRKK